MGRGRVGQGSRELEGGRARATLRAPRSPSLKSPGSAPPPSAPSRVTRSSTPRTPAPGKEEGERSGRGPTRRPAYSSTSCSAPSSLRRERGASTPQPRAKGAYGAAAHVTIFLAAHPRSGGGGRGKDSGPNRGAGLQPATPLEQPEPEDAAACRGPSSTRRDGPGEPLRRPAARALDAAATVAAADEDDSGARPPDQCAAG